MCSDYPCTDTQSLELTSLGFYHPSPVHPSAHLTFYVYFTELQIWVASMLKLFSSIASLELSVSLNCTVPIIVYQAGCDVYMELQPFGKLKSRISGTWEVQGHPRQPSGNVLWKQKRRCYLVNLPGICTPITWTPLSVEHFYHLGESLMFL